VRLVRQQEALSVRDLLNRLTQWQEVEVQKARAKRDEHKEQSVTDKFDSLLVFISQCSLGDDVSVVIGKITALFEQGKGVCLSTIHKAKGLEASKVLWLEREKRWRCSQAWQMVQESNAAYVAVTRAKAELVVA
jgi:superfamily I DNA/RNA helicase